MNLHLYLIQIHTNCLNFLQTYQGKQIILKSQAITRRQGLVTYPTQQLLQHVGGVECSIKANSANIQLQFQLNKRMLKATEILQQLSPYTVYILFNHLIVTQYTHLMLIAGSSSSTLSGAYHAATLSLLLKSRLRINMKYNIKFLAAKWSKLVKLDKAHLP